jgi:hypothetical protein
MNRDVKRSPPPAFAATALSGRKCRGTDEIPRSRQRLHYRKRTYKEPNTRGQPRKLLKDREALLAFYDFPAEHWIRLRTTDPIDLCHRASSHHQNREMHVTCHIPRVAFS